VNEKLKNIEKSIEDDYEISRKTGTGLLDEAGQKTLEKHPKTLDTLHYDMEFDIDPLFKKTSKKFDEGGASSLLLNTLSVIL
jgi:condensin complex subunit 2